MRKIISLVAGIILGTSFITTAFASYGYSTYNTACTLDAYICPNGTTVGRTGSNCQFVCPGSSTSIPPTTLNSSYFYTSGCYTYYYNGTTNRTSIMSNNCATTNYTNYNYGSYTYPSNTYYYTLPTTSYYNTSYTYPYTTTYYSYPSSYYYNNVGYTDTGYNTTYYYGNNNYIYTPTNSCYYVNGYYMCY